MLSILRRIFFTGIVIFLIVGEIRILSICTITYLLLVLVTFVYCVVDKSERMNFIEVIVRQDLRDPLIRNSKRFYQAINQFFSTFF